MRTNATPRLAVALAASAAGVLAAVLAGRPQAAALAAPWLVLLVFGLTGTRRRPVTAHVLADQERVLVGGRVGIEITVRGARGWVEAICRPGPGFRERRGGDQGGGDDPASAAPEDELAGDRPDPERDIPAAADVVGADGTVRLQCVLTAPTWGTHDVGRVELRVHEPYGLVTRTGVALRPQSVRVHPRPVDLQRLLAPWYVRRLTGAHRSRDAGDGVEYADIRPYGPGDSLRMINWWASARSDQLMVSRRHPDRSTRVVLLVDSFADSGHDVWRLLGETVEAAVALAESHLSVTDEVGLVELGGIVRWVRPGSGRHHLQRLVDSLLNTRLYESAADRDIAVVPARALPPRSFVLALSPLLDDRFVDALVALRSGGHDVAVVEFTPPVPDRSGIAQPRRPGRRAAPTASALSLRLWRAERALTRDRLTEQGVAVAERDPDQPWDVVLDDLGRRRRRVGAGLRP